MPSVADLPTQIFSSLKLAVTGETPTNGHASSSSSTLRLPHFSAPLPLSKPYVLEAEEGETVTLIGSGSIMRYLATGRETGDSFAVVQTRARPDAPVPPHFHRHAHDTWLVTKGSIKVWTGDDCRILGPGDLASAPPGVIHSFQVLSPDTDFLGLISPGSWTSFFKYISESYTSGPTFPWHDGREFPVPLFIEAVKAGEDVVPQRDFKLCEVKEWSEKDYKLPEDTRPYYLKANTTSQYILNSQSLTPLLRTRNSNGKFAVSVLSGLGPKTKYTSFKSAVAQSDQGVFAGGKKWLAFEKTISLFRSIEGTVEFTLLAEDDTEEVTELLTAAESVLVPAGVKFSYRIKSAYARMYVFSGDGEGLEEVFVENGREAEAKESVGDVEDALKESVTVASVKATLV